MPPAKNTPLSRTRDLNPFAAQWHDLASQLGAAVRSAVPAATAAAR